MPQEHYVLKCFSCETFQAHIVKKSKKWECKICGAKQSLKKNYGKGSGKDCRIHVMKLNELRLTKNDSFDSTKTETVYETFAKDSNEIFTEDLNDQPITEKLQIKKPLTSKWGEFLEENTPNNDSESDEHETDFSLYSDGKNKKRMKKKLENCNFKKKKIFIDSVKNEMFSQRCEEIEEKHNLPSPSINQTFDSHKKKEQKLKKDCPSQYKDELKPNKYTKYLEEQENENIKVIKKTANIFDSDTIDLDNLLNF